MTFGPFDVTESQITGLGTRFTPFINRLLQVEADRNSMYGSSLTFTEVEHIPDEGVDFEVHNGPETDWLPAGDSAWQFKRGDRRPAQCASEFAGADWAREIVGAGGSYVVVIGASLPPAKVGRRQTKIAEMAISLGLLGADDAERIRVYAANDIARWASRYPSLAVSSLLGGPGSEARDFDGWRDSRLHAAKWVSDEERDEAVRSIREKLTSPGVVEIRVEGDSGIGKTRLVLEALNVDGLRSLVAYVDDERSTIGGFVGHLVDDKREAVLVVDECPAERHLKLTEKLPIDPAIKLITIGQVGAVPTSTRAPILKVSAMDGETVDAFLKANFELFGSEARRFIAEHCDGNVRWATAMATRLVAVPGAQASEIIQRNDIEQFVADWMPAGRDFLLAAALALFERIGWDRELRAQLEMVADFAGCTPDELESVGVSLERESLMARQGRYRAVVPQPFAVYMATEAWKVYGQRVVDELLPNLGEEMALSLLRRTADLGQYEPSRRALIGLLGRGGPFGSLRSIEDSANGKLLTQLAIVMPDEVSSHLESIIIAASIDELLRYTGSRRDLVWTLEKLVWHTGTFESAADSLLRLAMAENESYANNATGTWVGLFGTILPGTAALPVQRIAYLASHKSDEDSAARLLVAKAAGNAIERAHHESIAVSGELQGGVLVEPRGQPKSWDEAAVYRRALIDLLFEMSGDSDDEVAETSSKSLISSIHPLLDDMVGEYLLQKVLELSDRRQQLELRKSVEHLQGLYQRHDPGGRELLKERLASLANSLPPLDPIIELRYLANLNRWELGDDQLHERLVPVVATVVEDGNINEIWDVLSEGVKPGAWELGFVLATQTEDQAEDYLQHLTMVFPSNPNGLLGYLVGLQRAGDESAFDDFLDGPQGQSLSPADQLSLAARGPATERSRSRILSKLDSLPVETAIQTLFGWQQNLSLSQSRELVEGWVDRAQTDHDYSAILGWVTVWLHSPGGSLSELRNVIYRVVMLRSRFVEVGQNDWEWSQLAAQCVEDHGREILSMMFQLMEDGHVMVTGRSRGLELSDPASELLISCVRTDPNGAWNEFVDRVEAGSWILPMQLRRWFVNAIPASVVTEWVGSSVERARLAASVASAGDNDASEVAQYLLEKFPRDEEVEASLYGELTSGAWTGPESARLTEQIEVLRRWQRDRSLHSAVREWAGKLAGYLESRRTQALEREAERGF